MSRAGEKFQTAVNLKTHYTTEAPTVATIREALDAVAAAKEQVLQTLKVHYPDGMTVEVEHARGVFTGTVEGVCAHSASVKVRNHKSGKCMNWYYKEVRPVSAKGGVL